METVYLAGPISGLDYAGAAGWRDAVRERLAPHCKVLSPMRDKKALASLGILEGSCNYGDVEIMSAPSPVFARDKNDVSRSDILLVNLLGADKVSIGTMFEIGYASAKNKLIVLVMEKEGNPHDHLFCTAAASIRVESLEEAVYATLSFMGV